MKGETMSERLIALLVEAATTTIVDHASELTALDQAIGDGDHGINMKRGFEAIAEVKPPLAHAAVGDALVEAGMKLVTTVGGASGPLYGSLLLGLGKAVRAGLDLESAVDEGVAMVKKRGKSDVGCKTLLDVLVPVAATLRATAGRPVRERVVALREAADAAREATKPMLATRGRASFLGERSIGHYDPGATSARLLVHAACDVWERLA